MVYQRPKLVKSIVRNENFCIDFKQNCVFYLKYDEFPLIVYYMRALALAILAIFIPVFSLKIFE
ncbi:MAG TPA: hypothetical protein DEG09_08100 [Marinilabiliaceae bacterium]|nr:hypothetical protein [Marinilabiliaceae bacterium]